jgi:hypothetical protein
MIVYDLGPQKPVRPTRHQVLLNEVALPPGAEGHPAIERETRLYAERYADFLKQSDIYPQERAAWVAKHGEALEIRVDNGECVDRDPRRYCFKLPAGMVASNAADVPRVRTHPVIATRLV